MKKLYIMLSLVFIIQLCGRAQLLDTRPKFITESTPADTILFDAASGNKGLMNFSGNVYVHIGVVTNKSTNASDWKYVHSQWGTTDSKYKADALGNNKWRYVIPSNLRDFFAVTDTEEKISRIAVVFRSSDGSQKGANTDGSDMFIPVYDNGLHTRIDMPFWEPKYDITYTQNATQVINTPLNVKIFSSRQATINFLVNNSIVQSAVNTDNMTTTASFATTGINTVSAEATDNNTTANATVIRYNVPDQSPIAQPPAGLKQGITYYTGDATKATLALFAPGKSVIRVIGDFNNWQNNNASYVMNKTADGRLFWITLHNLTPGKEYAYQYEVDGTLRVADYNAEKILDPWNDQYIDGATYPDLMPYPSAIDGNTHGIVSVLQTNQKPYTWKTTNFQRPAKENLRIYELLVRDFVAEHNWNAVKAKISYIKSLGMNAIELMPFNEFEGNLSWGYNPNFYFAPDKYYGTATALKQFIDECHAQGIAVIMDMVLNHSFGSSPMVRMYWDAANNQPSASSPWFNQAPTHPFNVGYDFNHESEDTKYFVSRVIRHWLDNYKIDGYRFDLSKGFTQRQSADVVGWNQYDQSRINTWNRYFDSIQAVSPDAYCILEHLGNDDEEIQLSNKGMILWENMNHEYNQLTMGWNDKSSLDRSIYTNRGWTKNNMVLYMESHDEERMMYKNLQYGNSTAPPYNVKDSATGYNRNAMAMAFWALTPGPKMIWQFSELGYPYSINQCEDGSIHENCRTAPKPVVWNYTENPNRVKLKNAYTKMMNLREKYASLFAQNNLQTGTYLGNDKGMVRQIVAGNADLHIVAVGNFDVTAQPVTITWPIPGTYYTYLSSTGSSYATANNATTTTTLQPGDFYVYTSRNITPLSLKFLNLTLAHENNNILLHWQLSGEVNIKSVYVERSSNSKTFNRVATITIQPKQQNIYSYTDDIFNIKNTPALYYRIVAETIEGNKIYSDVKSIALNKSAVSIQVRPNPSNTGLFHIAIPESGNYTLEVHDISGRKIMNKTFTGSTITIDLSANAAGMYLLKLRQQQATYTTKLIKL